MIASLPASETSRPASQYFAMRAVTPAAAAQCSAVFLGHMPRAAAAWIPVKPVSPWGNGLPRIDVDGANVGADTRSMNTPKPRTQQNANSGMDTPQRQPERLPVRVGSRERGFDRRDGLAEMEGLMTSRRCRLGGRGLGCGLWQEVVRRHGTVSGVADFRQYGPLGRALPRLVTVNGLPRDADQVGEVGI